MRSLYYLPLMVALIPAITIHTTYLVSAFQGYVPWCVPYWDSCTSISATGRYGASFYIFKATMLPAAFILMKYWHDGGMKLQSNGQPGLAIFVIGTIGAVFLIVYTVALGLEGDRFQAQRRVGIIIFFAFTILAQTLFTWRVHRTGVNDPCHRPQVVLLAVVLITGLVTLLLDSILANYDDYEDAFEWAVALMLQLYFVLSHWSWKALDSGARPVGVSGE
ncbi:MAG: hypothetical protein WDZ76_01290 [Pseudohongiellaceae bacterium]